MQETATTIQFKIEREIDERFRAHIQNAYIQIPLRICNNVIKVERWKITRNFVYDLD